MNGNDSTAAAFAGKSRRRRRRLICFAAPFLGLLLVEGVVRIADLRPLPMPLTEGSLFANVEQPMLKYVNRPSAEQVIRYDDGPDKRWSVTMRTNSQRFRGPEVALEKPAGVTRIACLGDSHTWGDGVEDFETWPASLQTLLGEHVEVLNCGVNGYDGMQEVLWYERFVEPFQPDAVLVAYFANDVAVRDLVREGQAVESDALTNWTHPKRVGFVRKLRDSSWAADLLCDRIFRSRSLKSRQDAWSSCYTADDPGWKLIRQGLLRLRDRCARDQRELRVLLFPYIVLEGEVFASHDVMQIVADFCRANDIQCFDGEPALLALLDDVGAAGLRVSKSDFHANAKAYAAFARATAEWLTSRAGSEGTGYLPR